jgi:hypothetical protein
VQLGGKNANLTPSLLNSAKWPGALSMNKDTFLPVLAFTDGKNTVSNHFQHVSTSIQAFFVKSMELDIFFDECTLGFVLYLL